MLKGMVNNESWINRNWLFFLIPLLTLIAFLALFSFRYLDDNKLTSWQWAFAGVNIYWIFFILSAGLITANILSRYILIERNQAIFLFLLSFSISAVFWKEPEVIVEPFIYGLIFRFFGESRIYIQIFTTLLFSMTTVLVYLTGRALWDKDTGFFAGLLFLGMPYLFTQVPLMLVDVATMFFLTLSIFTFIKALDKGGPWLAVSCFAIVLSFFSKYSAWMMLSVLIIIFLVYLINSRFLLFAINSGNEKKGSRPVLKRSGIIALVSALCIGIIILFQFDIISAQLKLLHEYQMPGLKRWEEGHLSTFFYQIHPFITIVAVYSAYAAFKKRDIKYVIICWLILIVVLLQIKRIRYIMVTFPMLALMASYGLQEIRNRGLRGFIVLCIVVSSLTVSIFVYLPFLQKMSSANLSDAGKFLNSIDVTKAEVYTMPVTDQVINPAVSVPILDIFTKKTISYNYEAGSLPSKEEVEKLPLRFTWEYKNPDYYKVAKGGSKIAVVVISPFPSQTVPFNLGQNIWAFSKHKVFNSSEQIFQHQTFVTVYYE
ncbi:MAG: glycosyltransferase family 39 protein [Nitrospirae bacterium]|nr:glycosyltransferase family 39 protein [Nitrospirota bacterium]